MERQLGPCLAPGGRELAFHRSLVHTDAHAGKLQRAAQRFVPEQQVPVQRPIVIVRRAAVVRPAGAQHPADAHNKDRAVLLGKGVFALFGRFFGPAVFQLLRGGERHRMVQPNGLQIGEFPLQFVQRAAHGLHNALHGVAQCFGAALGAGDHLFPVPLIDIDGMEIVHFFVAADGVHVGDKAVARAKLVFCQRHALPLRQRMHHGRIGRQRRHVKADRALHAVQIVVQARGRVYEQRRGNAL